MKDQFGRTIDYMRISITDRCNLRCKYCMPDGCAKVSMSQILTYEEIERICRVAARLGISKIKITGGEPLVRLGCTDLIRSLKATDGIDEVTITTNGQNLCQYIDELKSAGADGINISLDTLDAERYEYITGGGRLENVLQAIDAAAASGVRTKLNCVLQAGFNDDEVLRLAELGFQKEIDVRFIELMPIGIADPSQGVSNEEVLRILMERWPDLQRDETVHGNGPAIYYKRPGTDGAVGLISAIHGVFCAGCNRVRLTSQGQIKPCLCFEEGTDIKPYLQQSDEALEAALRDAIYRKPAAHCFTEEQFGSGDQRLMSQIGG
ncbi:MAG: GTP 3',8-cyclase MoaA [Mogibacterium sp.]|nr:GTP 3',8-cyclase MoaA [Mogibacterium sp.]